MSLESILRDAASLTIDDKLILGANMYSDVYRRMNARLPRMSGAADSALKNYNSLRMALAVCASAGCVMPAVMLAYAGMDIAGALYAPTIRYRATPANFKEWARRFVLPRLQTQVTAEDLYAGRCGVVHVYSPSSGAEQSGGRRREITYVGYNPEKEQALATIRAMAGSSQRPNVENLIILSVQEIVVAFDAGWMQMLSEVMADSTRWPQFQRHCAEQYEHMSMPRTT